MTEMTRKEKMAQEKAAWEAAQAAKKAAKLAKKAAKLAKKAKSNTSDAAPTNVPGVEINGAQPATAMTPPKAEKAPKLPKTPKPSKAPKPPKTPRPEKSRKIRDAQKQDGALQGEVSSTEEMTSVTVSPMSPAGLVVDLAGDLGPAKQARRARKRSDKAATKRSSARSSKKKSVTYKTALRMGLSEPVASMIEEKNRILALWKSRKITPELAVSNLSVLQARDPDGSVWRLLPRHGGYALVRTGHDGIPSIVEPPRKRRAWPAVVGGVLFSILIALALWGVINPATDGEGRIETPSTLSSEQTLDQASD